MKLSHNFFVGVLDARFNYKRKVEHHKLDSISFIIFISFISFITAYVENRGPKTKQNEINIVSNHVGANIQNSDFG